MVSRRNDVLRAQFSANFRASSGSMLLRRHRLRHRRRLFHLRLRRHRIRVFPRVQTARERGRRHISSSAFGSTKPGDKIGQTSPLQPQRDRTRSSR